jgi:hypothetical protein
MRVATGSPPAEQQMLAMGRVVGGPQVLLPGMALNRSRTA